MIFRCFSRSSTPVSSALKMAKRKAEPSNDDSKKVKENVRSTVERDPTPRKNNITTKQLKIVSANVAGLRGLLNNEGKKANFLTMIRQEDPDVIALQEHKLQEIHVDAEGQNITEVLPNYKQYWTCSTQKKGYSGVAFLVRSNGHSGSKQKSIKDHFSKNQNGASGSKEASSIKKEFPTPIDVQYGMGRENGKDTIASNEGRIVTLEFDLLFVINVYVPNSGQNLERLGYRTDTWDRALCKYMKELEKRKPVLLIGDLNVAHDIRDIHNFYAKPWFPNKPDGEDEYKGLKSLAAQAGCTKKERDSFTEFLSHGFVDTFRNFHPNASGCFTYWSMRAGNRQFNKGLRLDYVVTSSKMLGNGNGDGPKVFDSFILDDLPAFSDHCPVGCVVTL